MKPIVLWIVIAGLLAAMALAGGCTLDEIVEVDIPPNTRAHFRDTLDADVPPTLTLRDARILRAEGDRRMTRQVEAQLADHAASNEALDAEIADGAFLESLLASSINTGIETALPGLAAVPGGAILTTLLAGVGMWLAPRPGDAKRQAEQAKQAEDHGYDLGRQETLELLQRQKSD